MDGLDECGDHIETIASSILQLVASHPSCRVVVTTRPIGYDTALLKDWSHYELFAPDSISDGDVRKLIEAATGMDEVEREFAIDFARTQLKSTAVKALVTRTPMLIGLLAALSFNRIPVGDTKASFYAALIQMVQRAPNLRAPEKKEQPDAVLMQCLHVLGWSVLEHPAANYADMLNICAEKLQPLFGDSLLRVRVACEQALNFWEAVGLVERVRFRGLETVTFVHKTFGEYTAAKYLFDLEATARAAEIDSIARMQGWAEVLEFACDLGAADEVVGSILRSATGESGPIIRALTLLEKGPSAVESDTRTRLLNAAWAVVKAPNSRQSLRVGAALADCVPCLPGAADAAAAALDDSQRWTRLVAWTCYLMAKPETLVLSKLTAFMDEYIASRRQLPEVQTGFDLYDPINSLWRNLLAAVVKELVKQGIDLSAQAFVERLRDHATAGGLGYHGDVDDLLVTARWPDARKKLPKDYFGEFFTPERTAGRRAHALEILGALAHAAPKSAYPQSHVEQPLIQLSGFLSATAYMRIGDAEIAELGGAVWADAVQHVLTAILSVTGVDKEGFGCEVRQRLAELSAPEADPFDFYDGLLELDAELDWKAAANLQLQCDLLERAMHHPSLWIVFLAANLLEQKLSPDEQRPAFVRLLEQGEWNTLRATSELVKGLGDDEARQMLESRLRKSLPNGCKFLFDALSELPVSTVGDAQLAILESGLTFGPHTATSATKLGAKYVHLAPREVSQLARNAFAYWLENDDPPPRPEVVQHSPRADLLRLILSGGPIDEDFLFQALNDKRSDVSQIAREHALHLMSTSQAVREKTIGLVRSGFVEPTILRSALSKGVGFSDEELDQIVSCLSDPNPNLRHAALNVLSSRYLPQDRIREIALRLTSDPASQIRDRAYEILSR